MKGGSQSARRVDGTLHIDVSCSRLGQFSRHNGSPSSLRLLIDGLISCEAGLLREGGQRLNQLIDLGI